MARAQFDQDNATEDDPSPADGAAALLPQRPEIDTAAEYLRGQGITVVATSWRCPFGVIDVIAQEGNHTLFIHLTDPARPPQSWPLAMCQRLRRLALLWLAEQDDPLWQVRFDAVTVDKTQDSAITHHRAVF